MKTYYQGERIIVQRYAPCHSGLRKLLKRAAKSGTVKLERTNDKFIVYKSLKNQQL